LQGSARSVERVRLVERNVEPPDEDEVVDVDMLPALDGFLMPQDREEGVDSAGEETGRGSAA